MNDTKSMWASKTVWGGIVAILAGVLGLLGYSIDADTQAALVTALMSAGNLVVGLLTIWGRVSASKGIRKPSMPVAIGQITQGALSLVAGLGNGKAK